MANDIGRYCRPCGEILNAENAECPFCGQETKSVDDAIHEMFAERNAAFNEQVRTVLAARP
jgi:wobble nucleotide-excising tRNase